MSSMTLINRSARLTLPMRYLGGVLLVLLLTMAIFVLMMQPPLEEVRAMLIFLSITSAVSVVAAYSAYRLGWFNRFPYLSWTLLSGYILSGLLTFLNVFFTARLMFINYHDLILATILLVFATGIAVVLGYFVSSTITDKLYVLNHGAHQIAGGELRTRVQVVGRDELAKLAHAFNEMAAQLHEAQRKKNEMERMRRDLIAWVGHDLRTPLASVRAILEALSDGMVEDPATVDRYLHTAKRDIGALSQLLDDLFELAKLDAGGLQLDVQPNSLSDLISDTLESFSEQAREKGVTLGGEVMPATDPVAFDAQKIGRVLTNLVGNAVRYTPAGTRVHVHARPVANCVQVTVSDTGDGIPPEDLPHIFEQFYRGEKSRNRTTGGSGLGLAIAKGIVEAHGGQISVQSQPGRGTQFTFSLPRTRTRAARNPLIGR